MRQRLIIGFLIPLGFALLTSVVVYRITNAHSQILRNVTSTRLTSENLSRLIKSVIDAQTSERGFIITGDETFLEPYFASAPEFGVALSQLRQSLTDDADSQTLNEIDALFERWRREVAEVVIQARRQTPVDLSSALRGASAAFTEARTAELRYQLGGEPALLSRAGVLLAETQRQLERARNLSVNGPQRSELRAAAAQLDLYARAQSGAGGRRNASQDDGQVLDTTLAQLAQEAEAAEANVTALVRAGAGKQLVDGMRERTDALSSEVEATLARNLAASNADERRTRWVAFAGPLLAALVSLGAILQAQRRLNGSVFQLATVAKEVAQGRLSSRLALAPDDELHSLADDFNRMAHQLSERERQATLLSELSSTMQACSTSAEAYRVTERYLPQLLGGGGSLLVISASRNLLEAVATWGDAPPPLRTYAPSDCWALRRGAAQLVAGEQGGVPCPHAASPPAPHSLCVPLQSQGETLGVLHLTCATPMSPEAIRLGKTLAEQLALALSNLELRESLRQQSIRDPLTGLFNRRHLEETLELELHRAARRDEPLSVVMFDVDHFKRYNDLFGHDAGDAVLQALSKLIQQHIRAGDIACRFGGEEFLLLQPGMSAAHAVERAESLRAAATKLTPEHRSSGSITLSLGVACYPDHAQLGSDLVKRADEALYRAKRGGRNRVVLSAGPESAATVDTISR